MRIISTLAATLVLTACGGGGGSNNNTPAPGGNTGGGTGSGSGSGSGWVAGQYDSISSLENLCENPRTEGGYGDRSGSITDENFWIRSYSDDTYLWYAELPDIDPGTVSTTREYFAQMKTSKLSPTGNPKDQFHFTYDTEEWELLSQSGISSGYGMELAFISTSAPRSLAVAFSEPNSPAADNNISRGAKIIEVDGAAVEDGSADVLNAGLFPDSLGESHTFVIQDLGSSETRTVVMQSAEITQRPVQNVKTVDLGNLKVGYLTFNAHIATAESQLINAMNSFKSLNIDELVIDLRYNGGGYLDIAAQLGAMVAGDAATGRVFEETTFNDKYPSFNPITGRALEPSYFPSTAYGFSAPANTTLPKLDIDRVFVLTSYGTASASEAFINGLRGIDMEVILIGSVTRGKPYGFYGIDNCSTTYFTIQFKGSNAKGFGDYSDGLIPADTDDMSGAQVRGCFVDDDLDHVLGDENEAQFAAALSYIETGACNVAAGGSNKVSSRSAGTASRVPGDLKPPTLPGRILQGRR